MHWKRFILKTIPKPKKWHSIGSATGSLRGFAGPSAKSDPFLSATSGTYVDDMYQAWKKDPSSVHKSWDSYFRISAKGGTYTPPPTLGGLIKNTVPLSSIRPSDAVAPKETLSEEIIDDHLAVQSIINSYQMRGHLVAHLDPLERMYDDLHGKYRDRKGVPSKRVVRDFMLGDKYMDRLFKLPNTTFIGGKETHLKLREIIKRLENTYCGHISAEYLHLIDGERSKWIQKQLEYPETKKLSVEEKRLLLSRLIRTHGFETFLAKKWASEKRFGIEGCDILIPSLKHIIDICSASGVESFVLGMSHRGRLNVLTNVCRKPVYQILAQFFGLEAVDEGSGDVKYHLGTYVERMNRISNKRVRIAVCANPSHLESVDPVVQGRACAEQFYRGDAEGRKVMSITLHGDASFSGQGVVYETIQMCHLPGFTTHGTIHIVVNNQIGFTTYPQFSRSSAHCSDLAKIVNMPVLHVNSDDPESVIRVCTIAAEYRNKFLDDIMINIVCYRRNGHNEADEPMFTQPVMYKVIHKTIPVVFKYAKQLIDEKVTTPADIKKTEDEYNDIMEGEFAKAKKETHVKYTDWLDSPWKAFFQGKDPLKIKKTGIKEEILVHIGKIFSSPPPNAKDFQIHKGIDRILKARMEMVNNRSSDWALGEAFAFGSLLKEGIHVRLSGQDVQRGTFSHRHHFLHHQSEDDAIYCPLYNLYPDQAKYSVCNSILSEYAVIGFEFGYSVTSPHALVIWEAQFGDFNNTGQCAMDSFIASGQTKWVRQSGLVLSQPHGQEGMGPEHSSARPERFLQLCGDDEDYFPPENKDFVAKQLRECNWIVAICTTPAQYFHLLRRQLAMPFRKALVHFSPKTLLRHPEARSSFDEYLENTEFIRVFPETGPASKNPQAVKKLIFCCGKIYYEIKQLREEKKLTEAIAICRLEQISPFPFDLVKKICEQYPNASLCWAQEEHKNQGFWPYVHPRLRTSVNKTREFSYAGRDPSSSPSTGNKHMYIKEIENMSALFMKI